MVCQDPGDISLFVLKCLIRSSDGNVSFMFYIVRIVIALVLDCGEAYVLVSKVLDLSVGMLWGTVVVPFIIVICTLVVLGGLAIKDGLSESEKKRRKNRYFVLFKGINAAIAAGLTVGVIFSWDEFNITKPEDILKLDGSIIFMLVSLGIDVLMDPIEFVINLCICCSG